MQKGSDFDPPKKKHNYARQMQALNHKRRIAINKILASNKQKGIHAKSYLERRKKMHSHFRKSIRSDARISFGKKLFTFPDKQNYIEPTKDYLY